VVADEVPIEGKDLISVTDFLNQTQSYFDKKAERAQALLLAAMSWLRELIGLEMLDLTEDQTYCAVSSEMEMSVHGGQEKGTNEGDEEEEEGEVIML
jgi:hypothetical protein